MREADAVAGDGERVRKKNKRAEKTEERKIESMRDTGFPAGRLDADILERFLNFGDRVLKLAERLEQDCRPRRVVDQVTGSGTSPGAQMFEAHEALSRLDFRKCVGGAAKELSETSYWLHLVVRRGWLDRKHVAGLLDETHQLLRITKTMRARTRPG